MLINKCISIRAVSGVLCYISVCSYFKLLFNIRFPGGSSPNIRPAIGPCKSPLTHRSLLDPGFLPSLWHLPIWSAGPSVSPSSPSVHTLSSGDGGQSPWWVWWGDKVSLLPAGWWCAKQSEIPSVSGCRLGLTTNHDRHLTRANDQLPLVLKTNHFRDIRVNDGLSSYWERS